MADTAPRRPAVLYVTYDGVLEPLGESQVLAYLERLAADHDIALLSFEKPADLADSSRVATMAARLVRQGIEWRHLQYTKHPPVLSTLRDVFAGIREARAICRRRGVSIVHARSYVSSLVALGARGASGARYLFDMRGFWVDEKVEAGHWPAGGWLVRAGKFWERQFFRRADAIVSLTQAGVDTFSSLGYHVPAHVPVAVIPTCVDLQRFVPRVRDADLVSALGLEGALVVGSVGTLSNWYMRDETLRYLALVTTRQPRARVLFVTREDREALQRDAVAAGIPPDRLVITQAAFAEMPRYTALFDLGVFFIRPALSKRGSAATKLAEFLACGVPVIINEGVGDSGAIVRGHRVGAVLQALDPATLAQSVDAVDHVLADRDIQARCRATAAALFDVETGVERYRALYGALVNRTPAT